MKRAVLLLLLLLASIPRARSTACSGFSQVGYGSNTSGGASPQTVVINGSSAVAISSISAGQIIFVGSAGATTNGAVLTSVTDDGSPATTYVRRAHGHDAFTYVGIAKSTVTTITLHFTVTTGTDLLGGVWVGNSGYVPAQPSDTEGSGTALSASMSIQYANNCVVGFLEASSAGSFSAGTGTLRTSFQQSAGVSAYSAAFVDNTSGSAGTSLTLSATNSVSNQWTEDLLELSVNPIAMVQATHLIGTDNATFTWDNVAAGLIMKCGFWQTTATVSNPPATDTAGNTYVDSGAGTLTRGGGGNNFLECAYAKNIAGFTGTNQVTFQYSAGPGGDSYIAEFTGVNITTPVDTTSTGISTTTSVTAASKNTANANELSFGFAVGTSGVTSPGAGYFAYVNDTTNDELTEGQFLPTAGTAAAASASSTSGAAFGIIQVLLEAAPSGGVSALALSGVGG